MLGQAVLNQPDPVLRADPCVSRVYQVDTMLQREAAAQLPGNWCTFAQNCVMQLRDLEDAMQVTIPPIVSSECPALCNP